MHAQLFTNNQNSEFKQRKISTIQPIFQAHSSMQTLLEGIKESLKELPNVQLALNRQNSITLSSHMKKANSTQSLEQMA